MHGTLLRRRRDIITYLNYFLFDIYLCFFMFILSTLSLFHRFVYLSFLSSLPFSFIYPLSFPTTSFSTFIPQSLIFLLISNIFMFSLRIPYLLTKYRATSEVCISVLRYSPFTHKL
jgi:hypothetical protein